MGVPNSWRVFNGKSQSRMDDLGVALCYETTMRNWAGACLAYDLDFKNLDEYTCENKRK